MTNNMDDVEKAYFELLANMNISVETKLKGKSKHYFTRHAVIIIDKYPSLNSITGLITGLSEHENINVESFGVIAFFLKALMNGASLNSFYNGMCDVGLRGHKSYSQNMGDYGVKISAPQSGAVAVVEIKKDNGKIKFRRNLKMLIRKKETI